MISVGKVKESHRLPGLLVGFPSLQAEEWGRGRRQAGAIHRSLSARQLRVVIVQLIRPKSGREEEQKQEEQKEKEIQLDALHRRQLACVRVRVRLQRVSFSISHL